MNEYWSQLSLSSPICVRVKQMMTKGNRYSKIEYCSFPTRGLMGYRSEFINDTHGGTNGCLRDVTWKGEIPGTLTVLL